MPYLFRGSWGSSCDSSLYTLAGGPKVSSNSSCHGVVSFFHLLILRSIEVMSYANPKAYPKSQAIRTFLRLNASYLSSQHYTHDYKLKTLSTRTQHIHTFVPFSERPASPQPVIIKGTKVTLHHVCAKCLLHSNFIRLTKRIRPLCSSGRQLLMVHSRVGANIQPVGQQIRNVRQANNFT